jgi:hypothetical protein
MKIDSLMQSTGMCQAPELSMDAKIILEEEARSFLDSGGSLTLSDWKELTDHSRVAFLKAKEHRDLDQMCVFAQVMGVDEVRVASAYASIDGGEWLGNAVLEAKTEELIQKVGV